MSLPTASIVLPIRDERAWIVDAITSLADQDHQALEILAVDGGSTDGTLELLAQMQGRHRSLRVLPNPRGTAAAALNVGLEAARGQVLVRADAHAIYRPDYLRRSLEVLVETGADDVGGPMVAVGTTRFGRAVARVTSSEIAMGTAAFHYLTSRAEVDTVYLGAYPIDVLRRLGGWDEHNLQWGAEDHELNMRLRAAGGRIVCDPTIGSFYFPRDDPRRLWRQYRNYGHGKVSTLRKHRALPTLRPLAPATLVAVLALSALLAARRPSAAIVPLGWAAATLLLGRRLADRPGTDPARCALALAICHVAYGVGFWEALGAAASGRAPQIAPASRR